MSVLERPLLEFLDEIATGANILVTTHRSADADGVASAAALAFLITRIRPDVAARVLLPDKPKRDAKKLAAKLSVGILKPDVHRNFLAVACVDVGSLSLLSDEIIDLLRSAKTTLLIDHHLATQETVFKHAIVVEWPSSSEIIAFLMERLKVTPSVDVANSLLLGILADTKDFRLATAQTFKVVARLVEWGASIQRARSIIEREPDISERIAVLKSLTRAKLLRAGDLLVVVSRLSSYQAGAAEALVRLGADVAVVGGRGDSLTRVHMRGSARLTRLCALNLVEDVVKPTLGKLEGQGGGHRLAAALETTATTNRALTTVEEILREVLAKKCGLGLEVVG